MLGEIIQGTVVALAVDADGPLMGVLLTGKSGSGKSDLAARLISECCWQRTTLVADDALSLGIEGQKILATCPPAIAGMLELRGVGLVKFPHKAAIELKLVVDVNAPTQRLPEDRSVKLHQNSECELPLVVMQPFESSVVVKLRHMARSILARHFDASRQDGRSCGIEASSK